jgi:transcriptional regulator with XRE-family HTH domain
MPLLYNSLVVSQEQSGENYSAAARLKKLRAVTGLSWAKLAAQLEISEQFIYKINAGDTGISDKTLYKLEMAEREAGIARSASALREGEDVVAERDIWRTRAKKAEQELESLKAALRKLISPDERPPAKPTPSSPPRSGAGLLTKKISDDLDRGKP